MTKEELTALGLTEEQAAGVFKLNGKAVEGLKSQIATVTAERDNLKLERDNLTTQLTTANATLKKFGDKTPESMQDEIKQMQTQYESQISNLKKDYEKQIAQRDQGAWIDGKFEEYGIISPYAKAALKSEIMSENGLPWKDGSFLGFDDFMKKAKEKDAGLYQTKEEKEAADKKTKLEDGAPKFMGALGNTSPEGAEKKEIPSVW